MSLVEDILARAGRMPVTVSPLDAVMGEDWAALKLGKPRKAAQLQALLRQELQRNVRRRQTLSASVAAGGPQAMVKLIRAGGARDGAGLRGQMAYLSREGEVPLQRSENYLGVEVTADELAHDWGMPASRPDGFDRTSHFLVSFPHGTPEAATERAGRAWADEMFGSGRFGDTWDYYTAFHTDRAHPHLHVVVNRRGGELGMWLKVSQRSDLNYDAMREVQVLVAGREGIVLEASPRLARGVHDRPIPDREFREAAREHRAPVAPEHSVESAMVAAATVLSYARRYAAEAAMVEERAPAFARAMRDAAEALVRGQALVGTGGRFTQKEVEDVSEAIQAVRGRVEAKFVRIERELEALPHGMDRTVFERQAGMLKAEAAEFMPDREDLQKYRVDDRYGRFVGGLTAHTPRQAEIRDEAEAQIRRLAVAAGLDPAATVERYSEERTSEALADRWTQAEISERSARRAEDGLPEEPAQAREKALEAFHADVAAVYAHAREHVASVERDSLELDRRLRAPEGLGLSDLPDGGLAMMRNTLSRDQRAGLERGNPDVLASLSAYLSEEPEQRARLAGAYLDAMYASAPALERARLEVAMRNLHAREARYHGLERDDGHEL